MGLNQIVLLAEQVKEQSMGERLGKAFSNSVMSILIVFSVLFLISAIISSFRFINKYETRLKDKKELKEVSPMIDVMPEKISQDETVELVDDLELVAVITAAIYAYEEACGNTVPENGLYVRSIKKVNTNWRKA